MVRIIKNPSLRFRGADGKDYPDWVDMRLGDVGDTYAGLSGKTREDFGTGKPYVQYMQVFDNASIDISGCGLVNVLPDEKQNLVQYGDVIFTVSSETPEEVGMTSVFLENSNVYLNSFCFGYRAKDMNILKPEFAQFLFRSPIFRERMFRLAQGSTRFNISKKSIMNEVVKFPNLDEQKKIAGFLSAVDRRIELLTAKHDRMIEYKKGLMQKIFTQKIRFKDKNGNNYPDWEEKKLGDVGDVKMGSSPESKNYNPVGNGVPLFQGNADIKNRRTQPRIWTTEITQECKVGDILMCVRAPVGDVAIADHDGVIGRGMCSISCENNAFLYQYLLFVEKRWGKYSQGSTFEAINSKDIKTFPVPDINQEEQEKIATTLSAIDKKIKTLSTQTEELKKYKKSLMQQMFV